MGSGEKEEKRITRRDFVKASAVGAAAVAGAGILAGCQKETPAPTTAQECPPCPTSVSCPPCSVPGVPEAWDYEADVVVVGFGGAGAITAIAAHDGGAKVLVLEKAPEEFEGGNTSVAGGEVYSHQNIDDAIAYLTALNAEYVVSEDMVETWANKLADNGNYMEEVLGCETVTWRPWEEFPEMPGVKDSGCWIVGPKPDSGWGFNLWELYKSNIVERNIEVWYEAPGKKLVQNLETKEILGVVAERAGKEVYIKAKKAVVLTCGGFENNQEMVRDYLHLPRCYPKGTPYNTGDGIKMALEVGADLWHMGNMAGPDFNFKAPELPIAFGYSMGGLLSRACITVGANGKRFWNEVQSSRHGKINFGGIWIGTFMPLPVHAIFDETARLAGPIYATKGTMSWYTVKGVYEWSEDNSAEIEKGWITKADTIRELATKIDRDPDMLEETVNRYNGFCAAGEDLDFGRPKEAVTYGGTVESLKPIETPPYYAMELSPSFTNTQGGPRRNKYAQVLDREGNPIPRLYSAGELGSMYSHAYNGGMNIGETMAFGRIAAENAVKETPWS